MANPDLGPEQPSDWKQHWELVDRYGSICVTRQVDGGFVCTTMANTPANRLDCYDQGLDFTTFPPK